MLRLLRRLGQLLGAVEVAAHEGGAGESQQGVGVLARLGDGFESFLRRLLAGPVAAPARSASRASFSAPSRSPSANSLRAWVSFSSTRRARGRRRACAGADGGGAGRGAADAADDVLRLLLVGGGGVLVAERLLGEVGGDEAAPFAFGLVGLADQVGGLGAALEGGGVELGELGQVLLLQGRQVGGAGLGLLEAPIGRLIVALAVTVDGVVEGVGGAGPGKLLADEDVRAAAAAGTAAQPFRHAHARGRQRQARDDPQPLLRLHPCHDGLLSASDPPRAGFAPPPARAGIRLALSGS